MRLNEHKKTKLQTQILNRAFKAEKEKLKKEEHILAEEVYNNFLGHFKEKIEQFPENYFPQEEALRIEDNMFRLENPKAVPNFMRYYRFNIPFADISDKILVERLKKFINKKRDISKREKELKNTVQAVLKTVNTKKQLLEIWPESVEFFEEEKNFPLAVPIEKINKEVFKDA